MRFKKVLSYLELEGEGQGIIMEVTRPLLLGQFYLVKWPVNPNILAASVPSYPVSALKREPKFCNGYLSLLYFCLEPCKHWQHVVSIK